VRITGLSNNRRAVFMRMRRTVLRSAFCATVAALRPAFAPAIQGDFAACDQ
jgi:hypothetical protein